MKKHIAMTDLGNFSKEQADRIAAALEGKSFYNFHIQSSNYAGNHTLVVEVNTDDDEDEVRGMFIYCAFAELAARAAD